MIIFINTDIHIREHKVLLLHWINMYVNKLTERTHPHTGSHAHSHTHLLKYMYIVRVRLRARVQRLFIVDKIANKISTHNKHKHIYTMYIFHAYMYVLYVCTYIEDCMCWITKQKKNVFLHFLYPSQIVLNNYENFPLITNADGK